MNAPAVSIDHIAASLEALSNRDEQRRLWLSTGADGEEFSSFTEAVEGLFTDSGLSYELERSERQERGGRPPQPSRVIFDPRTDSLFGRLSWLIDKIDPNRSPEEVIDDPMMEQVRAQAAELLAAIAPFR